MLIYQVKGFTHKELYNMPIYLRKFYIKEYKEWRKAENENAQQSGDQNSEQAQDQAYQQYVKTHQKPSK